MNSAKFLRILLVTLIIILTFTPVIGYFPFFRRKWIFLLLGIVLLSTSQIKFYTSQAFFCLAFSAIVMLFNVYSGDAYYLEIDNVFSEISMLLFVTMMTIYAIREGPKLLLLKWIIMTFFSILMVETIASSILDQQIPGVIRVLFSESVQTGERQELLYPFYRLGLSNYMLPHAMPMLIPPLVMGIRENSNSKVLRIWSLFFLLFALGLVWLSGVMTAFLMAILFLLLSLYTAFSAKPNYRMFILFGVLFLPFFVFDELLLYVLQMAQDLFSSSDYFYRKLLLLEENVYSNEAVGDVAERQNLYLLSLQEFFNNILVGTNNPMGNHSAFIDRLGTLGLVGFVPYIMFYYIQLKSFRRNIPRINRIYYDQAMAAGLLMLLLKAVDTWEVYLTLFTIAPLLVIFLSPHKKVEK